MNPGARKLLTVITSLAGLTLAYKILQGPRHLEPAEISEGRGHRECGAKKTKIAFLKTHKCASSSVQNMLMRFGLEHELNFVLPSAGNYLGRYDAASYPFISVMCCLLSYCCQVCSLLPGDGG